MMTFYRIVSILIAPVLPFWLKQREKLGKEDPARRPERLGKSKIARPKGTLVWIHAASVGESASAVSLVEELLKRYPGISVLITTVTVTSAAMLQGRLPQRAIHQFAAVDTPFAVKRFLDNWKPDMALMIESELWPNLITQTAERNIPMVIINGRMSKRSFTRWKLVPNFVKSLLEPFQCIFAGSAEDAERFHALGAPNVEQFGNLKFDASPLDADPEKLHEVMSMVSHRVAWLAASTHPGEEVRIAESHQALRHANPNLLTFIVPRHALRGENIAQALREKGLRVALRSRGDKVEKETDVYLADTMGELGIFYRLAGIVFIGGSLVAHGGQNPLEAARLDCAIIAGPHMHNFEALCREMQESSALLRVNNGGELTVKVGELLADHDQQEKVAHAALNWVKNRRGVAERILDHMKEMLDKLGARE